MARIDIKSAGATLSDGVLQLENGVAMDTTLRNVSDQNNTTSPLKLSTTAVQVVSPLRITTDDPSDMYLDCEDSSTNNRFNITRNSASQQVNLNFASNPVGSTSIVGGIRTFVDGVNLSEVMAFREDGQTFVTGNTTIGNGTTAIVSRLAIKGSGSTSATTSLLVQNSAGSAALKVRDDGKTAFGNSTVDCTITGTAGSGNKFEFYAFNGYDIVDGFGNVLVTGSGNTIRLPRQVGIGFNTQNNASAILQADSTTKGFLPPRMTTAQKNAIATPAAGLMVYDTDLNKLCVYTTAWETITSI